MRLGKIESFNESDGTGVIRRADGQEIFFHAIECGPSDVPPVGTYVSFRSARDIDGRYIAQNIKRVRW
jgi:cold shock CspA family protein